MTALMAALSLYISACGIHPSTDRSIYVTVCVPYDIGDTPADMLLKDAECTKKRSQAAKACESATDKMLDTVGKAK